MASHHDYLYDQEVDQQIAAQQQRADQNNRTRDQQSVYEIDYELFMKGRDLYIKRFKEEQLIRFYREHAMGKFASVKLSDGTTVADEFQKIISGRL
jgi:hypothetical protein